MTRTVRRAALAIGIALALVAMTGAGAHAQVHKGGPTLFVQKQISDPGCKSEITAIEYLAADKLWFTTINGEICRLVNGEIKNELSAPSVVFTDIEMRGNNGLASAQARIMYRTTDGGDTWSPVTIPVVNGRYNCYEAATDQDVTPSLAHVRWANDNVAFTFGRRLQIWISTDAGATWTNWNRYDPKNTPLTANDDECRYNGKVEDAFFPNGPVANGFFVGSDGTRYLRDLANATATNGGLEGATNTNACGDEYNCTVAGDKNQPSKQVSSDNDEARGTEDTWQSQRSGWNAENRNGRPYPALLDVAYAPNGANGVSVAVGKTGAIYNSMNRYDKLYQLDPPDDVKDVDFNAVAMYDAKHVAIGGKRGVLLLGEHADYQTDVSRPVINDPVGPGTVTVGTPVTLTVNPTDAGYGVAPEDIVWSSTSGVPGAVGPTLTWTPTAPGYYTVRVNAKDRSGNVASEESFGFSVRPVPPPEVITISDERSALARQQFFEPGKDLPGKVTSKTSDPKTKKAVSKCVRGKLKQKIKRKKAEKDCKAQNRTVKFKIAGVLAVRPGFDRATACKGDVVVNVLGTKPAFNYNTNIKASSTTCKFSKTISFKPKANKKVTIRLRYAGNTGVSNPTYSKVVVVK